MAEVVNAGEQIEVKCEVIEVSDEEREETKEIEVKKRGRSRRVSIRQLELLWEYLDSHRNIAVAYNRSLQAKEYSKENWSKVRDLLNAQKDGTCKDWRGWSKYWVDLKAKLKRRVVAVRSSTSANGGGTETPLSNIENKFLDILGEDFSQWLSPGVKADTFQQPSGSTAATDDVDSTANFNQIHEEEPKHQEVFPDQHPTAELVQATPLFPSLTATATDSAEATDTAATDTLATAFAESAASAAGDESATDTEAVRTAAKDTAAVRATAKGTEAVRLPAKCTAAVISTEKVTEAVISAAKGLLATDAAAVRSTTKCTSAVRTTAKGMSATGNAAVKTAATGTSAVRTAATGTTATSTATASTSATGTARAPWRRRYRKREPYMSQEAARRALVKSSQQRADAAVRSARALETIGGGIVNMQETLWRLERKKYYASRKLNQCNECKKMFKTGYELKKHQRTHTGERPYMCVYCGKTYTQPGHLATHALMHAGIKNFDCPQCTSSFYRKADLDRHSKIHTGIKPFQCDVCSKSFTQKTNLVMHLKMHKGDRPHKCDTCEKSFITKCKLVQHKKKHDKVLKGKEFRFD